MSGPVGSQQWMYSSGFYPHEIDNSARLDNNSYYTRTPSSASNRTTWTWSAWIKMPPTTSQGTLFFAEPSVTDYCGVIITGAGQLQLINRPPAGVNASVISAQVFRDPSVWYHIVGVWDTTNSTQSERVRLYVNGERITSFNTLTLPPQNAVGAVNSAGSHRIGATVTASSGVSNVYNGYMSEVNFIDGQALGPTSFGENKSGVWIPKSYSGTYGTNGYYLDFATRATDPIDASGNGNNWGSVNVASTDWMLDSPTNNFATINPLIERWVVPTNTYSEGNLKVTSSGTSAYQFATMQADKIYFEMLVTANNVYPHISVQETDLQSELGSYAMFYGVNGSSRIGGVDQTIATYGVGDIVALAYDHYGGEGRIYKNGTLLRTTTGQNFDNYMETYLAGGILAAGDGAIFNFGQDSSFAGNKTAQGNTDSNGIGDFYYQPPAGFLAICSANLPDPVAAINPALGANPQDHFNTVTYTGNGATTRTITGVGFDPDLVWQKSRSTAIDHNLIDRLRGAGNNLSPNQNYGDYGGGTNGAMNSVETDGASVLAGSSSANNVNQSSQTYVLWNWKAGGSGSSNSDGTISATVSANTDAGFSIATYNGSSAGTVGHGLGSTPKIVIQKVRNQNGDYWWFGTTAIDGSLDFLQLNDNAVKTNSGYTAPTSSVFSNVIFSGATSNVAYCFAEVEGFSKFGSYTGNGNADGPFVYCGFRPAWVIIKRTDSTGDWRIYDNKRSNYNAKTATLYANHSLAEYTSAGANEIDTLSNGFKIRNTNNGYNASSGTYLYMAFAEMPFKYANAR